MFEIEFMRVDYYLRLLAICGCKLGFKPKVLLILILSRSLFSVIFSSSASFSCNYRSRFSLSVSGSCYDSENGCASKLLRPIGDFDLSGDVL